MDTRCKAFLIGVFGLLTTAACLVMGQNSPSSRTPPASSPVRDNYGPQGSRVSRLTADALDKATADDEAAEKSVELRQHPVAKAALETAATLPLHRISRDVMLHGAAASNGNSREWQITLKNSFIEKYKNRATLSTPFRVVQYRTHPVSEDGDAHVAGLPEDVGLACVAEIMNIKSFPAALRAVKASAASGDLVPVTGVWRLWCEHPDAVRETAGPQIQDDVIPDFDTSNPNHVFEIHPVSRFGSVALEDSFEPIPPGYNPKKAQAAFQYYESVPCRIVPDPAHQTTTLFTRKVGYNYAEFVLKLEEDNQFLTVDGRIVRCSVQTLDGNTVAENRRMVFVKDTAPELAVRGKTTGHTIHVLGIPRIDLALVSYRTRVADTKPEVLNWNLPYEMVVVGLYESQ